MFADNHSASLLKGLSEGNRLGLHSDEAIDRE